MTTPDIDALQARYDEAAEAFREASRAYDKARVEMKEVWDELLKARVEVRYVP